jgi:hypothetical protein
MYKTHNILFKQITKFGFLLMMGLSMTACGAGSKKWKEEVQLSDGKIIIVERESIYESGGDEWASNRSGSKIKAYHMRLPNPDGLGKMIEWRTTKIDSATYPEVPLVLDMELGNPTIFTLLGISATCEVYSKYVYKNGIWAEEKLSELFEQHTTNLLFGNTKDIPTLVSRQERYKRNSDSRYRKALRQVGPNHKVCEG